MASAIKYLTNVTKSVKYASIDAIKEMNPVITSAIETNEDVLKTAYSTIKNFKAITNKAYTSMKSSQIGELAIDAKKNLFEDIKNGTFYNKERIEKAEGSAIDDFFNDDDFAMEEGGSDDFGGSDEFGMDDLADTMDSVGEKSSSAVSQVIARSAEYQVEATKQSTMQILARQSAMTSMMHSDLAALNTNMANVQKFNTEVMTTHINNSANFYARQQEQMSEQTELLRKLVDITERHYEPKKETSTNKKLTTMDIMDSQGNINIANYAKYVKQNMQNNSSGMGGIFKTMMDMGIGKTMTASPLQGLTVEAVKKIIPGILKESMQSFNETISNSFSNILMNLSNPKSDNNIMGMIGKYFGINDSYRTGYDSSKYNKEATSWSGKDSKALTVVIPTLLGKIYSAVSGEDELRFDYSSGKFIKTKSIAKRWKESMKSDAKSAGGELFSQVQSRIDQIDFGGDEKAKKQLQKDLESIMKYNLENMKTFNPRDVNLDARTYGLSGNNSDYNVKLIAEIIKSLPKTEQLQMKQAKDLLRIKDSRAREMDQLESQGDSIFNALFDGSLDKSNKSGNKSSKKSPYGRLSETNKFLYNINKEVAFIREIISTGKFKKGGKKLSFDTYDFYGDNKKKNTKEKSTTKNNNDNINVTGSKSKEGAFTYGSDIESINNKMAKADEEKAKQTFLDKMIEANTLNDKFKVIMGGVNDLAKAPAKFLAGVLGKADHRIYEMLFGTGKNDEKSLMNKITSSLNDWVTNQTKVARDKWDEFKDKMKKKFSSENIDSFFTKALKAFGFDKEKLGDSAKEYFFGDSDGSFFGNIKSMFKKGFSDIWGGIKNAFKSVGNGVKGLVFGNKNDAGKAKEKKNKSILDFKDVIGDIGNAAKGIKRVKKTGIIAVSEGEMIVPPDQNPHNIKRREYNENIAINKYKKYFGDDYIPAYAKGGKFKKITADTILKNINDEDWLLENIPFNDKSKFNDFIKRIKTSKNGDKAVAALKKKASEMKTHKMTKSDYKAGHERLDMRMKDEAKNIKNSWSEAFAQTELGASIKEAINKSKNKNAFKEAKKDIGKNIKDYLPTMAAGGVTGAALSAVLGIVGGPLLGAAAGTSLALIKNSDKVQNWLFGEEVTDENGNSSRKGGVLSKELSNNIQKYFPDMAKGSIVGGITSILPFVPGGPITGVLLGSAIGFAKNNEKIKNALFGEDKILGKAKNKVQKMLPKMGLGAMAGIVAGPFGLVTNIAVGSALGMAADTNKFKDFLFGKEGFNGKRYGGVTGFLKDRLSRFTGYITDIGKNMKEWFTEKIMTPIQIFLDPLKRAGKNTVKWFKRAIDNAFEKAIKHPIGYIFNSIGKKLEKGVGKLIKGKLGLDKFIIQTPFGLMKQAGQSWKRKQLRSGKATDLSASERIHAREQLGPGKAHRNSGPFGEFDKLLVSRNKDQIHNMNKQMSVLQAGGNVKKLKNMFSKNAIDRLYAHLNAPEDDPNHITRRQFNEIKKLINDGYPDRVQDYIMDLALPEDTKKNMVKCCVKAAQDIQDAYKIAGNTKEAKKSLSKVFKQTGMKVNLNDKKTMQRLLDNLQAEDAFRNKKEEYKSEEEKQKDSPIYKVQENIYDVVTDRMDKIIGILEAQNDLDMTNQKKKHAAQNTDIDRQLDAEHKSHVRFNNNLNIKGATFKNGKPDTNQTEDDEEISDEYFEDDYQEESKQSLFSRMDKKLSNSSLIKKLPSPTSISRRKQSKNIDRQMNDLKQNGLFSSPKQKDDTGAETTNLLKRMTTYLAISAGDTKGASELLTTSSVMGSARSSLKNTITNKASELKNSAKQFITDASGRILKTKKDAKGDTVIDTSDSETNNALKEQKAEQGTQKGILGKITGLADGFKGLFGKKDDDDGDKKGGFFSKLFSGASSVLGFGKGILSKLFSGKALAIGGGLAGLIGLAGLSKKTVKTKKKDADGNVMTDENGNPIYEEKTIGNIISSGIKNAFMGEDGTGNTSGIIFHIKDFGENKLKPLIDEGVNTLFSEWIPRLVELLITHLPDVIAAGIKGVGNVAKSTIGSFLGFGDSDAAPDSNSTSSAIEGNYSAVSGGTTGGGNILINNTSNTGTTTTNTTSNTTKSATIPTIPTTADLNNKINANIQTTTSQQTNTATTKISDAKKKTMRSSQAFKNTNENVRRKATGQLDQIWDQQTVLGKTVGEILNDKDTVLGTIVDQETGKTIELTGANILNYPQAAQQLLGVNVSLTDEERSKYTKELGLRQKKDTALNKMGRGIMHRTFKGLKSSKGTTKVLKAMDKITAVPGKIIKAGHPGVIRNAIGTGVDAALNLPFKAVKGYDTALDNISVLGFKDGMHYNALVAKDIAKDSTKKALKKTKTAKRIERVKKVKNFVSDKTTKVKNFAKKHSKTVQNLSDKKNAATKKIKDAVDNKKTKIADTTKTLKEKTATKVKDLGNKAKTKITEKAGNLKTKATQKIANSKVAQKVVNSKAGGKISKVAQKVAKKSNKGLISKAIKWASDGIKGFFKKISGKVAKGVSKLVGGANKVKNEVIVKALEKAADKITDKFGKNLAGKAGAKVLGKLATYIGTSSIAAIADAMVSFASGMYNADVILKVKSPNFLMKVLCGAANAVNNVFCLGIIDTGDIFEFIYTILKKVVPALENSSFEKSRKDTAKEVKEYNKKNGTNLSVEEYLKKDKFTTKIANGAKKVWGGVKKGASVVAGGAKKVWNGAKNAVGGAVDKAKDIGSKAWNGAKNVVGGAVDKAKDVASGAVNKVKSVGSSVAKFFGWGNSDDKKEEKEDTKKTEKSTPAKIVEAAAVATNPVLGAMQLAKTTKNIASGAFNTVKNLFGSGKKDDKKEKSSGAISKMKNIASSAVGGIKDFFGFGKKKSVGTVNKKKSNEKDLKDENHDLVKKATKESQRLVAINLGLADATDKNVDLAKILGDKKYLDKRARIVQQNSSVASMLSGVSGSNTADEKKQTKEIAKANQKSNTKNKSLGNTIVSGVKKFFSGVGNLLWGKGSGISTPVTGDVDHTTTDFISQRSSKWANKTFKATNDRKRYTIKDAGCAPAAASMAINTNWQSMSPLTMNQAIKDATPFKIPNGGGVTADYFVKEFANHGFETSYVAGKGTKKKKTIIKQLKNGNSIVLMGVDPKNKSKKSSPFGPNAHYVVATGLSADGKFIYINDPEAKKPNIAYPIDTIIKSTTLGIIPIKSKKKITSMLSSSVKKALKRFSGKATGKVIYIGMSRVMGIKRALSDTSDFEFLRWADYKDKKKGKSTYKEGLINKVKEILSKDDDWGSAYIIFYLVNDEDKAKDTIAKMEKECGNASVWQVSEAKKNGNKFTSDSTRYINIRDFVLSKMDKNGKLSDEALGEIHDHISEAIGAAAQAVANNTSSTTDSSNTGSGKKYSSIFDVYTLFDDLAKYYGLADGDSSESSGGSDSDSSDSGSSDSVHLDTKDIKGNVSKDKSVAENQKKLVAQMKSVEGKLKYSNTNRDPDTGSGDCSSTVQWAYKKVLGDKGIVGNTTADMRKNSNTYQVTNKLDESKMQLGDLVLMPGHVEMYAGDGITIGHGGGVDGSIDGPTINKVSAWPKTDMIRRLNSFKGKGSGVDGFVSQTDSSYRNKTIKDETVEEAGCAPAVASMMVSRFKTGTGLSMNQAIKNAVPYKSTGGGISADYFIDQLEKQGLSALLITGKNKAEKIIKILKTGKPVALLGQNAKNKSKNKCPFGPQAHYVLAIGVSDDNRFIYINDPESKKANIKYSTDQIIPYVQIAIAGIPKNQNKELDKLSKKIKSELKKFRGRGEYSKDSAEYKVWHGLRNAGYSEIATAAAMGNIYAESSFNPKAIEAGSGAGFGLIQWTGGRRDKIVAYAKNHNKDVNSVDLQVEYLLKELDPNSGTCAWSGTFGSLYGVGPYTRKDWTDAKKVDIATKVYCTGFERPAVSAYNSSIQKRITAAEGYYKSFMGSAVDPNAISSSGDDSGDGEGSEEKKSVFSTITDLYSAFGDLAAAYGLGSDSSDSSSDTDSDSSSDSDTDSLDSVGTTGSDYPKYKLSKDQVKFVAGVVTRETGGQDKTAAMQEASQMANLNEVFKKKKATASNLISTLKSGWYNNVDDPISDTKIARNAVKAVMNKGHRVLPRYVTEHDMFPLDAAKDNTWKDNNQDRSKYEKDKTKIKQNPSRFDSPAEYTFYDFFGKNKDGDVSGYYDKDYKEYKDDIPWSGGKGSGLSTPSYSGNSSTSTSTLGSSNTKIIVQNQNNNDTTSQLINIVVKLLSQVVDNTSSIKDIASLLVKVLGSNNTTTKSNVATDANTQALMLQALQQSSQSSNIDSSLESLIANVEAIAAQ